MNADERGLDGAGEVRGEKLEAGVQKADRLRWWDELLQTKRCKEYWAQVERRTAEMKAERDREKAEELKAEELKAEEIRKAKHNAWLKVHIAMCNEMAAPGYPKKADLLRWISRLGGTTVLTYAMLQDLKEMVYSGLHFEEARAILRLAVGMNAVALRVDDQEVIDAQAKVEVKVEGRTDKTDSTDRPSTDGAERKE
jgi:hypothetical protein